MAKKKARKKVKSKAFKARKSAAAKRRKASKPKKAKPAKAVSEELPVQTPESDDAQMELPIDEPHEDLAAEEAFQSDESHEQFTHPDDVPEAEEAL